MCHAEDVVIYTKWQIDGNLFCFNIYIYIYRRLVTHTIHGKVKKNMKLIIMVIILHLLYVDLYETIYSTI